MDTTILETLDQQDREQMQQKGIAPDLFVWQLQRFAQGFPPLKLLRPAAEGDGVSKIAESEIDVL
ncbi:MAG: DUF4301 family protein, partial [Bacteroidota bacterium]